MKRIGGGLAAVLLVAALSACASPVADRASPPPGTAGGGVASDSIATPNPGPISGDAWTGCADARGHYVTEAWSSTAIDWPKLAADFVPVSAVVCQSGAAKRADGGTDEVLVESRATAIDALVAAYRLPDEPVTGGGQCVAMLVIPPDIALLDAAGHWVRPKAPANSCGNARSEVMHAARTLATTEVSRVVVRELISAGAAKTGCDQAWADMIAALIRSGETPPSGRGSVPIAPDTTVRLCVYTVPASEQSSGKPRGDYAAGSTLSPAQFAPLRSAIEATGPAAPCSTAAGRFAVIQAADNNSSLVYLELDGCRRVMAETVDSSGHMTNQLAQGDPALAELIRQLTQ